MTITVRPSELIKRCLWDNYVYYILGGDKHGEALLTEDNEFEISERDALVIGLIKVIETTNLIHKFNTFVVDSLSVRCTKKDDLILINKKVFDGLVAEFTNKFPPYWQPNTVWEKSINDMREYVANFTEQLMTLPVHTYTVQNIVSTNYNASTVRKLLKFNYD